MRSPRVPRRRGATCVAVGRRPPPAGAARPRLRAAHCARAGSHLTHRGTASRWLPASPAWPSWFGASTLYSPVEYQNAIDIVNTMVERSATLGRTYAALADPTRRALLVALRNGRARISDLARPLPMSFAGVSRHVGVLEDAGLIRREVRGREHWLTV